jgi:hypothetical protein
MPTNLKRIIHEAQEHLEGRNGMGVLAALGTAFTRRTVRAEIAERIAFSDFRGYEDGRWSLRPHR